MLDDTGIEPVTIAMAASPGQLASRRDSRRQSGRQLLETFLWGSAQGAQADQCRNGTMQQMIKVESVAALIRIGIAARRAMNARQGYAIRSRVSGRVPLDGAPPAWRKRTAGRAPSGSSAAANSVPSLAGIGAATGMPAWSR